MASKPASQVSDPEDPPEKVLPASQSLESLPRKIAMLQGHRTTPRCPGGSRKLVPHRGHVKVTGVPVQAWHAPQYPWRSSSGW